MASWVITSKPLCACLHVPQAAAPKLQMDLSLYAMGIVRSTLEVGVEAGAFKQGREEWQGRTMGSCPHLHL